MIFVIITDGQENASLEFTYKKIKEMISDQKSKYSWKFIFLGANIDDMKEAQNLGIRASRAANYMADKQGVGVVYSSLADTVASFRAEGQIREDWSGNINKDINKRKKKR